MLYGIAIQAGQQQHFSKDRGKEWVWERKAVVSLRTLFHVSSLLSHTLDSVAGAGLWNWKSVGQTHLEMKVAVDPSLSFFPGIWACWTHYIWSNKGRRQCKQTGWKQQLTALSDWFKNNSDWLAGQPLTHSKRIQPLHWLLQVLENPVARSHLMTHWG